MADAIEVLEADPAEVAKLKSNRSLEPTPTEWPDWVRLLEFITKPERDETSGRINWRITEADTQLQVYHGFLAVLTDKEIENGCGLEPGQIWVKLPHAGYTKLEPWQWE